ncbi:MAG: glycosyltransferase [Bdellovibrionota bacterium]
MVSVLTPANVLAAIAVRLSGHSCKLVVVEHGSLKTMQGESGGLVRWLPFLQKIAYRLVDRIVCVSEGLAEEISKDTGISRDRFEVVYNAVLTKDFHERANRAVTHEWIRNRPECLIVMVGRLHPVKDYELAVRTLGELKRHLDCKLIVVGEGPYRSELEKLIVDMKLSDAVSLVGFRENPLPYIAAADVFLMTSRMEALPTVLIEALCLRVRTISVDCPWGPREIFRKLPGGVLVRDRTVGALVEGIRSALVADRPEPSAEEMAVFAESEIAMRYQKLVQQLLDR